MQCTMSKPDLDCPRAERTPSVLELEHFLPYRLSVLSNRISQAIARIYAERFDLSITEWRLMAVMGRYPDLTAAQLVERTAMDKVAVSRAVARLMESGRVIRTQCTQDRRRAPLRLSVDGQAVYEKVAPLALDYERSLIGALDHEQCAVLDALLKQLDTATTMAENRLRASEE
jgi:DNA-binding MarR family transcriptional regulator